MAESRKELFRLVKRAQVIEAMLDDPSLAASRAGEESWFHEPEKHDPEFVEKRGSS